MTCENRTKRLFVKKHIMPTVEELIHDLNGANVFSKLDLRSRYHQLELDEQSKHITVFSTHLGLFQYKRLYFGISMASEIFQETIRNVVQDIPGVKNISNDIIIFGKDQKQHDIALEKTLQRLSEKVRTLNKQKCELNKSKITCLGVVFSNNGISPCPLKVKAIKEASVPIIYK